MSIELKEVLFMFKREQDYAERKNQIIFIVLSILTSVAAAFISKISNMELWILLAAFISIAFTVLGGFFPQGTIIKPVSKTVYWLMKKHCKKYKKKDDNYLNYANWKNFELTDDINELEEAMDFFNIPINKDNKNICQQMLVTSKIIYLKYLYFQFACILMAVWSLILILVFAI